MKTELVKLANLKPPARNVRSHPDYQIAELARAVEKFGQTRPVIIDEDNTILAGNALALAHKRLGRAEITAHRILGLSKADKSKLMLSDNRIFGLGIDDNVAILDEIRALGDFDIPGFDPSVLEKLSLDTSDVTNLAMSDYGVLSKATVELARADGEAAEGEAAESEARGARAGETEAGPVQGGAEAAAAPSEGETICPACGHVFRPSKP
jgi:hypothetical protein